jgi:protoheme IX farnesyltransferase
MRGRAGILEPSVAGVSDVRDYWLLLKPNVMSLVVFSAAAGLFLAPGHLHPVLALTALLCIAVAAGASAAINNGYDADIDRIMPRTRRRPTATGRISPDEALAFGVTLAAMSVMVMGLALNWVAAALLALTVAFYVFVYTVWLKRRTPQNIVIGGAAGALPPVVGWASVTGDLSLAPIVLFLIIFVWTPPHFWALSLYRAQDYAMAGVPMLPVVAGPESTRRHILVYTLLLVLLSLAPVALGFAGPLYGVIALALGAGFLGFALRLWRDRSLRTAMRTFRFSIVYLFGLFGALVTDHAVGLGGSSW